jgi:rhodanese-related sulfurtransferase
MLDRLFASLFAPQPENVHVVDPITILGWVEAGEAVLYDVREPQEFTAEHIPGATSLPLSAFDSARISVPEGKKLVIHCRSGSRCGMAAGRLAAAGYVGEINRMQGGLFGWKAAGGATTRS